MRTDVLAALHANTPDVAVKSNLNMPLLTLRLLRQPDDTRVRLLRTRTELDLLARTARVFGARPLKAGLEFPVLPDATSVTQLEGRQLKVHTCDGDTTLTLTDNAGRPLWAQNAQGTCTIFTYEAPAEGGRLAATFEHADGGMPRQRERLLYAPADAANGDRNLAGNLTEQFDNAGVIHTRSRSLTDQVLETQRQLLRAETDLPDWASGSEDDLETPPLLMTARHDATGALLESTNAAGIATLTAYDISGAACISSMRQGEDQAVVFKDVQRRADGAVLSQTAGNGVIDSYAYSPFTHRLNRHQTARPITHPLGGLVICDLHYHHDPAGNLLALDDQGADPTWHRNQQVSGPREYAYDTLYRLVSATGRERAAVGGFWVAAFSVADRQGGMAWSRYTEHYAYDDGDNLIALSHNGGAGARSRKLAVSTQSNRALPEGHGLQPDTGFLPGGLQMQLADGRPLEWQADNQLRQVRLVGRDGDTADDTERYHYADGGTRTRKVTTATIAGGRQTTITTYLSECEIRQQRLDGDSAPRKDIAISEAGGLRWVHDRVSGVIHLRYGFSDHLGSVGGETDHEGKLVTREEYAPFGETTGLDEAASEADGLIQRTWRYSGKELDASGLYYYGWRYYQPGLTRWLSADPGGLVDGANLYRMCRNNPMRYRDNSGLSPTEKPDDYGWFSSNEELPSTTPAPIDLDEFGLSVRAVGIIIGATSLVLSNLPYLIKIYELSTENRTRPFSVGRLGSAITRHARTLEGATNIATAAGDGIGLILELAGLLITIFGGGDLAATGTFLVGVLLTWIARGIAGGVAIRNYNRDPQSLRNIPLASTRRYSLSQPTNQLDEGIEMSVGNYRSLESTPAPAPQSSVMPASSSSRDPATSSTPPQIDNVVRGRLDPHHFPRNRSPSPVQLRRTRSASPKGSKRLFKG